MATSRTRRFFRWLYRNRSISSTPEGTRFVLLALAIGLAAVNTGNNLLYLLLAMMLSLIVLSGILSEQCLKRLAIHRRFQAHIFAGRPTTGYFSITNQKIRVPSFSLQVMDVVGDQAMNRGVHVLNLAPGASTLQAYRVLFPRRGRHGIQGVKLLTRFPFSLFIKGLTLPLPSEVVVYPAIKPLPSFVHEQLEALGHDQPVSKRGRGGDLYNLRLYQSGDDSRSIHWKTTARTTVLTVRETEAEDQRRVSVALPTVVPPSSEVGGAADPEVQEDFEKAVELTASVAAHFQERGFAVRAVIGDQEIPEGTGEDHLYRILRVLGLCQPISPPDPQPTRETFRRLLGGTSEAGFIVLVLPWDELSLASCCAGAGRIFRISEFKEAIHGR